MGMTLSLRIMIAACRSLPGRCGTLTLEFMVIVNNEKVGEFINALEEDA